MAQSGGGCDARCDEASGTKQGRGESARGMGLCWAIRAAEVIRARPITKTTDGSDVVASSPASLPGCARR